MRSNREEEKFISDLLIITDLEDEQLKGSTEDEEFVLFDE